MGKDATVARKTKKKSHKNKNDHIWSSTEKYQLCCCCLELVCLKSLWAEYTWMGETEVYGNMLKECFNLSWPQTEKSKDQICEVCITQVRNAVYFKQKVLQSQATLKAQIIDFTSPIKEEETNVEANTNKADYVAECGDEEDLLNDACDAMNDQINDDDTPLIKAEEINSSDSHLYQHNELQDIRDSNAVKRKVSETKKGSRRQLYPPKKRETVNGRKVNYIKPRQNVCLILEHSTILPFKSNKGYFNCLYCNKQFVVFEELKTHVSEYHENISFKLILKSILRPNDRIRADVSDINCRICKCKLDNLDSLIKHLSEEHGVKFNFDSKIKPSDCILAYNLSDGKFKCCQCKEEFLFFKTLSKHMNDHSTDYVCDICGRCFLLPERLRAHTQMHLGKSVKCEICGKVCSSNILLKSHIRYTHKKLCFMCSVCDQTFPSHRSRMKHLEEVHKRAPLNLTCKICSKKFATPNSLNNHMRTDHLKVPREPKYGCNICGMMFKSRHALTYHAIVHSGEKKYECDICHKKYARAKTLTEHLKIHMNDRRWSCGACSQAFVQKCSLKNHIRVHHVDMDFEQLIVYKKPDLK